MKYALAAALALAVSAAAACGDRALERAGTAPAAVSPFVLHHEIGGANPVVYITNDGLQPRRLEVPTHNPVTFINRSSVNRWIRSDPHAPDGHSECPEFEAIGILAPGQSGKTGTLTHERCKYHDHLMGAALTSDFEGSVRIDED
jgi:hypothetical protein